MQGQWLGLRVQALQLPLYHPRLPALVPSEHPLDGPRTADLQSSPHDQLAMHLGKRWVGRVTRIIEMMMTVVMMVMMMIMMMGDDEDDYDNDDDG